jgi:hypothetical protein
MNRSSLLPKELCGVAAAPLLLPAVFAQDMQRHGHAVDAPVLENIGYRNSLADEFRGATGFQFEWGMLVAGFPEWYYPEEHPPGSVWRIVPTALWQRAGRKHCFPEPIHHLLLPLYANGHDALWPRFPRWIEANPGLNYDVCAALVQSSEDAARLFDWLEHELLPRLLPPVLRLMEASLQQVLRGSSAVRVPAAPGATLH